MQFALDDVRIDALIEGAGPTIVLLHGFPLAKQTWDAQAIELSKRARVVRLDLRGLGASSVPAGPYLMETLASDVRDVLDALEVERATIVGHSLGGYVAFAFFRLFSERCAGLGLVATRAGADDAQTMQFRLALADTAEREGIEPVVASFLPRFFSPEVRLERPQIVARTEAILRATDPRGAAAMLRGMAVRVASDDLFAEIAIPVRVVGCARDAVSPLERSQEIAHGIAGSRLDVLDCGHLPLYEDPDGLSAALVGLLAEVGERAASL